MSKHGDTLFAVVSAASSGDNSIVAAQSGKQIKVYSYVLVATGAVSVTWKSDTGGSAVALSGAMSFAANGGISATGSRDDIPLIQTASGKALNLSLSGATAVGGHITYGYE